MKKLFTLLTFLLTIQAFAQDPSPCTDLFFSEYIEGTSNNKALELYNPTPDPIDLTNYSIKIYFNGATTAASTFLPQGILLPGQTFTIANSSSTIFTAPVPDTLVGGVSVCSFNGDDAVALFHGTDTIDIIGVVGVDPGTSWTVGTGATAEFTLVRKSNVHNGYLNWLGSSDLTFDVHPQNTIAFFGSHTMDPCPAAPLVAGFIANNVCLGEAVNFTNTSTGGTGPFTYVYDFTDGDTSHQQNPIHTFMAPGCYNVSLVVTGSDLEDDTITIPVCVFETPAASFTISNDTVCLGQTVTVTNTSTFGTGSPGTYAYDFGDGTIDSTASATHTYGADGIYLITFWVTSAQGCVDTLADTIVVIENDPMAITADSILCNDSFGMFLEASNPAAVWSGTFVSDSGGGDGFFSSAAIASGTYEAYCTTTGLCGTTDTVFIYVPTNPVADFTYTITGMTVEFTNNSTNAVSYNWTFGTAGVSTDVDPVFVFPATGSFNVCLEAASDSGCIDLQCINITITGLNEWNVAENVRLYPNPADHIITVTGVLNQSIQIINATGQVVLVMQSTANTMTIDVSNWATGIYTLKSKSGQNLRLSIYR